ncbi:ABC transporter ATP-binding protein [Macrococcus armenti]|uniref:ABC transporter ATP-binding protein n=1 Tax=Macrococcus armenti TaxID=2875764 RepID=UPI001CCE2836|nr:ABC transporter ATP-binding protein [Macrococcus armenti]UBH13579.1 ABC transporter ATP-binding protein [Macrococcus armenti]UBH22826.1 ABC transporter ATP-binding protein [Macrococcus armenti]
MTIQLNSVSKSFGNYKAVDDVNLSILQGSIQGLLGSNGAGKTTLLKLIAGIYKCDDGNILYNDEHIFENKSYKEKMIFISDIPYFFGHAALDEMAEFYKLMFPKFSDERYKQLVEVLKINPKKKITKFSKGMQRQCAFILGIASRPEVLLLDEPFDGLDPIVRHTIKNILIQDVSNHNVALFVSSHNLREMEDFCDSVTLMHEGRVLMTRDLDDLKGNVAKIQMAFSILPDEAFYKGMNVIEKSVKGRVVTCIVKDNLDNVEEYITKADPLLYDILPLTLEEIFTYELGGYGYAIENVIVE